ncbi:AAA family ATPase [Fodinibius sp. N2]|uniref:AAA family ATPase n=1 Tax=Fodinibius alkaliphilus TaxID=3140241 RepID=UPI003159B8AF
MIPENITKEHINNALAEIDKKGVPQGRHSTTYDLLCDGKTYPPKLVLSIANKYANGEELDPSEFKGGEGTPAFKKLKELGYDIIPKKDEVAEPDTDYNSIQKELIERYKKLIQADNNEKELYKWQLVKEFQQKWDIDAENFAEMAQGIEFGNLLDYRSKTLIHFVEDYPEEARSLFKMLYDETIPVKKRIDDFGEQAEELVREHYPDKGSFQDERTIATYLTFRYPDKYTFYKYSFYSDYTDLLGIDRPSAGERYIHYLELIEKFIDEFISKDKELIELSRKTLTDDCYEDDNLNLLAQDILFRTLEGEKESESDFKEVLDQMEYEQASKYFNGLQKVVKELKVEPSDQRVVFSVRTDSPRLNLTIGQRYCLSFYADKEKPWRFIHPNSRVNSKTGEKFNGPPEAYFHWTKSYTELQEEFDSITAASLKELERTQSSSFKKYNNDFFEKAVFDDQYKREVFKDVFDMEADRLPKVKSYLKKFSEVADQHFTERAFVERRYEYFQDFFKKENLKQAEWSDFQEMGEKVHGLATNALALKRAFGDPNHDIKRYRKAFLYLAYGDDPLSDRINAMLDNDSEYHLKYLAESFYGELVGYLFPEKYVFYNRRDKEATSFLELDISRERGESFGDFFIRYNNQLSPLIELYKEIVGRRTETTIPLELDQFFSWLYENHVSKEESDVSKEVAEEDRNYWWLNANPDIWRFSEKEVGQEQWYTSRNDNGNKRRIYQHFQEVEPGDLIIGYESTPVKRVKAVLEVTEALHTDDDDKEKFTFRLKEFTPNQPGWDALQSIPELESCSVLNNNQGSLFKLTEDEFLTIRDLAFNGVQQHSPYTMEDALNEVFMQEEELQNILDLLEYKKNIILQGPPGTGKTFLAKRLAWLMSGFKDRNRIEVVQFHQSYSYEDFIRGYRPTEDHFELKDGIFMQMCKRAKSDPENRPYFLVIDEINRGNLSKIFGELMMLIENDKRGKDFTVKLPYRKGEDDPNFYIPKNLHLIGTMNTADRSLAMVDYALRRRFVFIDMMPNFGDKFQNHLKERGVEEHLIDTIVERLRELNNKIADKQELGPGPGYQIGHSYFCGTKNGDEDWYKNIIEYEIIPLLNEYWFDKPTKVEEIEEQLLTI